MRYFFAILVLVTLSIGLSNQLASSAGAPPPPPDPPNGEWPWQL